ncbi:MAG TPA: hypothetical protein VJW95_06420 [Dissulfurispiraceae bacterium]|nr:hypothetical protein [Dissulfurispiraceae bacterium]
MKYSVTKGLSRSHQDCLFEVLDAMTIEQYRKLHDVMNQVWNDNHLSREEIMIIGYMLVDGLDGYTRQ